MLVIFTFVFQYAAYPGVYSAPSAPVAVPLVPVDENQQQIASPQPSDPDMYQYAHTPKQVNHKHQSLGMSCENTEF